MGKIIILPSWCGSLGGMTVSLSMTIAGFAQLESLDRICVLVRSDSLLENYLQQLGQGACLEPIAAANGHQFYQRALSWVARQPRDYPLLLENCTSRYLLPILGRNIPRLKLSRRRVYHVFRDLAYSHNLGGKLLRQAVFICLAPGAICNSQFTAQSVAKHLRLKIQGILYPPVDRGRFCDRLNKTKAPQELQPILDSGAKIMFTPSRISEPGHINDKNLRGLILVLAKLKEMGNHYHGVIIGQDYSPDKLHTRTLLELAQKLNVSERLTILPPSFAIEDYYQHADVVVTLAPREPFGRSVVEAISCGVPVVGSNTGGIGEILGNFAPQWTVDPDEPMAVAQTIIRLAGDSNTSSLLAQGQKWVESHCDPLEYAKKMMEIVNFNSSATRQEQTLSTFFS
ncbi:MAG: glycosyltransferase family 4 protein [Pleurocapsa sp. MO_192.B19]|nr:glycosyltransferase family 4 protein [Pleurocapsa sp. MO_192.B19]